MTNEPKVLIVDDDNRILELLKQFFAKHGFESFIATDADSASEVINNNSIDLLVLDVMLPNITGFEFASKVKRQGKKMPIILLTALSDPEHRVQGLESGADDYLTKPFDPRELILRAKNLLDLYKSNINEKNLIIFGDVNYNLTTKKLIKNKEEIFLSSTEQKLLEIFIANKGSTLSREDLSKKMGGLNDRSIDVQVVRLRQKIEEDQKQPKFLLTVRHEGYALYI